MFVLASAHVFLDALRCNILRPHLVKSSPASAQPAAATMFIVYDAGLLQVEKLLHCFDVTTSYFSMFSIFGRKNREMMLTKPLIGFV